MTLLGGILWVNGIQNFYHIISSYFKAVKLSEEIDRISAELLMLGNCFPRVQVSSLLRANEREISPALVMSENEIKQRIENNKWKTNN